MMLSPMYPSSPSSPFIMPAAYPLSPPTMAPQPASFTPNPQLPQLPPGISVVVFRCPPVKWQQQQIGYLPLGARDVTAFQTFAPITVGYHLDKFIDPQKLCQSLAMVIPQFYTFTGAVVLLNGVHHVKTAVHEPSITAINVPLDIVSVSANWNHVIDHLPLREGPVPGAKMMQILLLHTPNPNDGCTLLVTLDHAVADATSIAFFVTSWSKMHTKMFGGSPAPKMPLPQDLDLPSHEGLVIRRIYFQSQRLTQLKNIINDQKRSPHQVTVNDILMAMCASALAAHTAPRGPKARVSMMADPRGRVIAAGFVGNGAMPMDLYVDQAAIRSNDLAAVAITLRHAVLEALETLKASHFNVNPAPPTEEALMEWNSWARAQNLLDANFGTGIRNFEWVNLRLLTINRLFIVYPTTNAGGLGLQVALPPNEMAYLLQIWNTYLPPS